MVDSTGLLKQQAPARFAGLRPVALDDTKELRWSLDVWGVCTFKHLGRNANRPHLVRGHNWVVAGDLSPGDPWLYRPLTPDTPAVDEPGCLETCIPTRRLE